MFSIGGGGWRVSPDFSCHYGAQLSICTSPPGLVFRLGHIPYLHYVCAIFAPRPCTLHRWRHSNNCVAIFCVLLIARIAYVTVLYRGETFHIIFGSEYFYQKLVKYITKFYLSYRRVLHLWGIHPKWLFVLHDNRYNSRKSGRYIGPT